MPVVKDAVRSKGGGRSRVESDNKVELTPKKGTARFIIADIWIYDCDERGKFAKHAAGCKRDGECAGDCPVNGQKSRWVLQLKKNPKIALENRQLCGLGPKSRFQQRIGLLTGTEPGSDACKAQNTDDLIGREVLATYEFNDNGYTDITGIMPLEDDEAPAQQQSKAADPPPKEEPRAPAMITERQQREINGLLQQAYSKGWTPETVRKNCLKVSDGAADETRKLTAVQADRFFTGLRKMLFQAANAKAGAK